MRDTLTGAVGVYDSGLGGLTAWRELRRRAPALDLLYFGDSAYAPYGEKTPAELLRRAETVADYFESRRVRALLVACGTLSAAVLPHMSARPFPLFGVIDPLADAACRVSQNKRVLVLATPTAVTAHTYRCALTNRGIRAREIACPAFVTWLEGGRTSPPRTLAHTYLDGVWDGEDTLLLGCTHYLFLRNDILSALPPLRTADAGTEGADALLRALPVRTGGGRDVFLTTGDENRFSALAGRLLGMPVRAERVLV